MKRKFTDRSSNHRHILACTAIALVAGLTACGGGNSSTTTSTPSPTPSASTVVQLNMGDAPADWMLAFSMNINSMTLTRNNGSVTAVSSTTPMEMMHLMGTMQPLAMISAPQGNYTGATISIGSANITYMDPATKLPVQKTIPGPITGIMNFNSPITVGSTPMAIGFDLDLANSVTRDASGNMTLNPVFHVTSGMQGVGNPLDPANGGIQQMMGAVSSVSGTSFTMASMQAAQALTFHTSSTTTFDNITGMSMMANGMLVIVDASLQPDGSLMATRVQSMMNSGGFMGGGVITTISGQPATQFTIVMQNGAGAGMMSSYFSQEATVNLSGSTVYQIKNVGVNLSNLPFAPIFDANHIYAGQSVMPISAGGMMMGGGTGMMGGTSTLGSITASGVALQPQGFSGSTSASITSGSTASFTLTLSPDSAFTTLTGATAITVYQLPDTTISSTSPIASGATVRAFGLLFRDNGQWKMAALRIGTN
ncbi:MAG TPA: DUF5666 domain-containing protein [Acidisarcina sp.]|nr:DUF5666 domain-containing protein [Acidisarcina sp.]